MVEEIEDEEAVEEQMEEAAEKQHEIQSELYEEDTTPTYGVKDDLWTLFKWVVAKKDSTKIGNLDMKELGLLPFSVRNCQDISLQAKTLGHKGFGIFFYQKGENILASSLSKNMAQQNLFVSQTKKKTTERNVNPQQQQQQQQSQQPQNKGFFRKWR